MKYFKAFAILILSIFVLNILISLIVEYNTLTEDMKFMHNAVILATKDAEQQTQVNSLTDVDYVLKNKSLVKSNLEDYLSKLRENAKGIIPSSSSYYNILDYLDAQNIKWCMEDNSQGLRALGVSTSGTKSTNFATSMNLTEYNKQIVKPLQFDLTYMSKDYLQYSLNKSLVSLIDYNYGDKSIGTARHYAISGFGQTVKKGVKPKFDYDIKIEGPVFVPLTGTSDNEDFESIFGVRPASDRDTSLLIKSNDPMFRYIIVYDITVKVKWAHHTSTPFFRKPDNITIGEPFIDDNNQVIMNGLETEYKERYVLTN